MKKFLLSLFTIALTAQFGFSQNIVTTIPQYKSTVLEEYTGIHCVYCPDGHKRAKELKADHPGRVVLVNIHQGGYATPSGNEPDFRTIYGNALAAQINLTGYPTGTINRRLFTEYSSTMAMSRSAWRSAAEEVMEEFSPVNIGAATEYNPITRNLKIHVEVYYSGDAPNNYNLLNVALIQDSILGPQTGGSTFNPGDIMNGQYVHGHMFRGFVVDAPNRQWGDTIPNTTKGSLFTKTYNYTLPHNINGVPLIPKNCHLALYVAENRTNILNGTTVHIDNDTTDGNNAMHTGFMHPAQTVIVEGNEAAPSSFSFEAEPSVGGDYTFDLIHDAPSDWNVEFTVNGTTYNTGDVVTLNAGVNPVTLEVTPGASHALAELKLRATAVSDNSIKLEESHYVVKGVTELVVNGSGSYVDGNTYNWEPLFQEAFDSAGAAYGIVDADIMMKGFDAAALNGINSIYMNIGWTSPPFTDEEATTIMDFMDNGGNFFVSGQDIGYDIDDFTVGTNITRDLYWNYLKANFKADGGATNNSISTADTSDAVFGTIKNSNLDLAYGTGFFPDEISPRSGAKSVLIYNNDPTKTAGVRYENNFKSVYLAVGWEMIANDDVRNEIMRYTYGWFNNSISTEEFDRGMAGVELYPNPTANGKVSLKVENSGNYTISVVNAAGKEVYRHDMSTNNKKLELDLQDLPAGIYLVNAKNEAKTYSEKLVVE